LASTFSKRLIISFLTSFCGFPGVKLGIIEGESLKRSSIPLADGGVLLSAAFSGLVFSAVDTSAAAETVISKKLQPKFYPK